MEPKNIKKNKKNDKIGIFIAVVIVLAVFIFFGNFLNTSTLDSLNFTAPAQLPDADEEDKFLVEDLIVGEGDTASLGDAVTVHYIGTLTDGTEFDSSVQNGEPLIFLLGAGSVIRGWDLGIEGMQVGGVRRLTIPPSLGYGSLQAGPIPPNSTLLFDVELLGVETP